jgi:hypothetical protein
MTFQDWLRRVEKTQRASVPRSGGKKYPYKDVLLAAVLIRISSGKQSTTEVILDSALRALYTSILKELFPGGPGGPPDQPFRHLEGTKKNAPVWRLEGKDVTENRLHALVTGGADFSSVMALVSCARLDQVVLQQLILSPQARLQLANLLIHNLRTAGAAESQLPRLLESMVLHDEGQEFEPHFVASESTSSDLLRESVIEGLIVKNWETTRFAARGVQLHDRQYRIPTGIVDLLGWQREHAAWWVIELKKGIADDRVIGQLLRYTGWIRQHKARPKETVRGVILAKESSEKLQYAASEARDVEIWTFDENLQIHPPA